MALFYTRDVRVRCKLENSILCLPILLCTLFYSNNLLCYFILLVTVVILSI